jgi:NAD(P)H-hydrate epimerase
VLSLLPERGAASTKFSSGQVVIVGASRGLTGAVCLAASAAIRAGAGYATVAVPAELEQIFEVKLTEVMSVGCASREGRLRRAASEQILKLAEEAAAVVLGPGIGREDGTKDLVRELARRIEAPLVIDADGLNAHAGRLKKLRERAAATVLTPDGSRRGGSRPRGRPPPSAARPSCSRATTRSSPTASGSPSTAAERLGWPPLAPVTCSPGSRARSSPAASSPSPPPAQP